MFTSQIHICDRVHTEIRNELILRFDRFCDTSLCVTDLFGGGTTLHFLHYIRIWGGDIHNHHDDPSSSSDIIILRSIRTSCIRDRTLWNFGHIRCTLPEDLRSFKKNVTCTTSSHFLKIVNVLLLFYICWIRKTSYWLVVVLLSRRYSFTCFLVSRCWSMTLVYDVLGVFHMNQTVSYCNGLFWVYEWIAPIYGFLDFIDNGIACCNVR